MRKIFAVFAVAVGLALSGCANSFLPGFEKDATPSQRLLGLEANYGTAFVAAAQYEDLPRCSTHPDANVCSKQDVVDRMRAAHTAVKKSLDTAWATVWAVEANDDAVEAAVAAAEKVVGNAMDLYNSYKSVVQ